MIFILTETILYLVFMGMDLAGVPGTEPVKFAAILLLALSALDFREPRVSAALLFTAAADVFLLLLDRYYAAGIACFLVVQILYASRLAGQRDDPSAPSPGVPDWLKAALSAAAGLLACTSWGWGLTEGLAAAYIALFALNLLHACRLAAHAKQRRWTLFAIGLALFFCCDLCVGVHNMPGFGSPVLQRFANVAMWGFYLPGQVLIRQSAYVKGAAHEK